MVKDVSILCLLRSENMSTTTDRASGQQKLRLAIPNRSGWASGFQSLAQYLLASIGLELEILPAKDFDEVEILLRQLEL